MDDNYVLKEGSPTSPMLDEHSTATIIEKTVDVSDIGEFIIGESNSSIITFRMNRYYDGVDLLEKTIKVMYRNSNGIFESDVVNIKYTSNSLKFSWIVPHDATTSKKLLAYVCFVSDGYLWKTKTFTITVDQSFDVGDSEPTQNWFVNIESKLTKIEKTIDEAVGKLSEQIPTKVSDLENDLAVSYSAQELTSEQKQQVRENIDIGVSKKVVTYNGAKRSFTVGVIEGAIADLPEDSASEYLEAYKNFWHVCEYIRIFKLTTWQFAKNALKWLSSAHKNNIISDSLTFYVTKPSKYIKYSYNVNTQGRAYDLMEYYDEGATLKLSYYPDTDEFEDNQMDAKWSKPITMNSYGLDNNTASVEQFELSKNPTSDMEVTTKKYVDDNIGVSKKVITYDGASSSHTILISEGTVNDITSDSTEEFIEGYKTFYSAIQQTRFVETPYWRGLKTLLKKLSDAHKVGIISDKLTYSVDQSFTEINYSYGKARDNKYFDCIVFINNGKKARLSYYPDTDEYSTNDSDNYIKEALIKNTNGTDSTNSFVYQFNMDSDPTSDMQVATKQYVDKNSTKIDETLTTEQKATIRDNINAIGYDPIEIPCDTGTIPIIYMIDGTFTPLAEDADEELKTAYTSFVQFIKLSTSLTNLPVKIAQNMVKSFSKMCDNGIISSSFYFYETDRFDKSIKYERTEEDGKKVDALYYDFRMRYTAVSYYPETDTFDTNPNYKEEQPLLSISDNNGKNFATKQFAMKSDPTENMEIATKQYVDNNTMYAVQGVDCPESLDTMINSGYCYIQEHSNPYPSDFPDIADKTKDSVLICYRQTARRCARQVLYNGNDKVFTRYGYPEMGNIIWNDWTDLTSSSIMYIHVTSEEKDGETVYKSDKTYEEIKEAIDSGKSPVVIYQDGLFFTLDINFTGDGYIFTNSRLGVIGIGNKSDNNNTTTLVMCYGIPPYVTVTWGVNNMDVIIVQIKNDELTHLPTDIDTYYNNCKLFGKIPAIKLHHNSNGVDPSYDVLLYDTGNDFAGTTFINGNLTYCRLTMKNMSDTSTWDYTETEIPELYANMSNYVSTDNIGECSSVLKDKYGNLYNERSVKYYDAMDKISNQNTANGIASIAYSKGTSDIDIPYPAMVYSTQIQSYGNFEGWIVDACGNHYTCTIESSGVILGKKNVSNEATDSVMYVYITSSKVNGKTTYKADKTVKKILEAYNNGAYIICVYNKNGYGSDKFYAPLKWHSGTSSFTFKNNEVVIEITNYSSDKSKDKDEVKFRCKTTGFGANVTIDSQGSATIDEINGYDKFSSWKSYNDMYEPNTPDNYFASVYITDSRNNTTYRLDFVYNGEITDSSDNDTYVFSTTCMTMDGELETYRLMGAENKDFTINWTFNIIKIPQTDEHINTLIDKKLGVIENGTY